MTEIKVHSYIKSRQVPYDADNNIFEAQYMPIKNSTALEQSFAVEANYAYNSGIELRFLSTLDDTTTGRIFTLVNDASGTPVEIAYADLKWDSTNSKVLVDVVFGDKSLTDIEIPATDLKKKIYFNLNYLGCTIADTDHNFDAAATLPTLVGKPKWLLFRSLDNTSYLKNVNIGLVRLKVDIGWHLLVPAQYRATTADAYRMCYYDQATNKEIFSETTDPEKVKETLISPLQEYGTDKPQRIAVKER